MLIGYVLMGLGAAIVGNQLVNRHRLGRRVAGMLSEGATVLDVRSREEFSRGHSAGSVNIPLDELPTRAHELNGDHGLVVCCVSGARAGRAANWLARHGFSHVVNGGSWRNLPN